MDVHRKAGGVEESRVAAGENKEGEAKDGG